MSGKANQQKKADATKLFADLEAAPNNKVALQVCEQILAGAPNDNDAIGYKLHLLIESSRFSDAIKFVESCGNTVPKDFNLQIAYCHYRLNKLQLAEEALSKGACDTDSARHLMAQIQYKLEDFAKAAKLYHQIKDSMEEDEEEVICNLSAATICAGDWDKALKMLTSPDLTHDLLFNKAYLYLKKNDLDKALSCLKAAERDCREEHMEAGKIDETALAQELATVKVQTAYILACQGQEDAAIALLSEVMKIKPNSFATLAVGSNNLCALQSEKKTVFDAFKRLKPLRETQFDTRLSAEQRIAIRFNTVILMCHMRQSEQARRLAESIAKEDPENPYGPLALSTVYFLEKKYAKAEEILKAFIESHASAAACTDLQLVLAQIYFHQGNMKAVVAVLKSVSALQHQLGVVATLVAAYEKQGNVEAALGVFKEAIAHWESSKESCKTQCLITLLRAAARFRLKQKQWKEASDLFRELQKLESNADEKLKNTAGLVLALSRCDVAEAERLAVDLDAHCPASSMTPEQASEILAHKVRELQAAKQRSSPMVEDGPVKEAAKTGAKKKRRPGKKPEGATGEPDPDRWRAMRDRTAYKALTKRQIREIKREKQEAKTKRARLAARDREGVKERLRAHYEALRKNDQSS
ncbi:Signal recognition particle subunit SRP72 [Diplonema papillatum]|nr:Signal recognition particle subunit SRP72 [Diplonema papillatum]